MKVGFSFTAEVYTNLKVQKNIHGQVLMEQAEDETIIIKMLQYQQQSDSVVGSCGPKGYNHVCQADYIHIVGDAQDSYE